ncbi:hypothetical protein [Pseudonocardia asaccharolytica]|uniref:hypothetical protein n=1 Tax=Pseudonocardia asaccharolytica TaxID=54010 RepID=UPI00048E0150|nr:hypothetical protein [Pseudonocardia asaccharolytica]
MVHWVTVAGGRAAEHLGDGGQHLGALVGVAGAGEDRVEHLGRHAEPDHGGANLVGWGFDRAQPPAQQAGQLRELLRGCAHLRARQPVHRPAVALGGERGGHDGGDIGGIERNTSAAQRDGLPTGAAATLVG